ncbi:MAG: metallophosphoesterase family protein [Planctomycetes bacterium]|nr:metallophosphoesterase family protein [Planctomycetota bacterium]
MKAIISDLHSNIEALDAVLEDIAKRNIKEILCLGDIVGYGPSPEVCIDRLKEVRIALLGNHDEAVLTSDTTDFNARARRAVEWTRKRLNDGIQGDPKKMERWNFLERLTPVVDEGKFLFIHGSPRSPTKEYVIPRDIRNRSKMQDIFRRFEGVCFGGHSHLPGVFTEDGQFLSPQDLCNVYLIEAQKAFVNVGSVGQPRDGNPEACYVTFDDETVVWRRIPYDVQATRRKIHETEGLDDSLGDRLLVGK